jgi:site-specific DNA-cytosine methylase
MEQCWHAEDVTQENIEGIPWEKVSDDWELMLEDDLDQPLNYNTATNHATRSASSDFLFVELFSGLGAFTLMLIALGGLLLGYCENNPVSSMTFRAKFPNALHASEYDDLQGFKPFVDKCTEMRREVDLVAGGPSCKSFSVAGKQDWSNPRALCASDSALVVNILKPKAVLLEITVELLTKDSEHGLFTRLVKMYDEAGYFLAGYEMVRDSELGGNQSRRRLLLTLERKDVSAVLPPLPSIFEYSATPRPIAPLLEPASDLPQYCWLNGEILRNREAANHECKLYPVKVATLVWGGPTHNCREGSIVTVARLGSALWRVVQVTPTRLRVCKPNCPTDVSYHWINKSEAVHRTQREKVYSIHGVSMPIRAWGESLGGAGMLVLDDRGHTPRVRTLVPVERWRIQGHSMEDWQYLGDHGISEIQRAKMAGESIPTAMASAACQRAVDRIELYKSIMSIKPNSGNDGVSEMELAIDHPSSDIRNFRPPFAYTSVDEGMMQQCESEQELEHDTAHQTPVECEEPKEDQQQQQPPTTTANEQPNRSLPSQECSWLPATSAMHNHSLLMVMVAPSFNSVLVNSHNAFLTMAHPDSSTDKQRRTVALKAFSAKLQSFGFKGTAASVCFTADASKMHLHTMVWCAALHASVELPSHLKFVPTTEVAAASPLLDFATTAAKAKLATFTTIEHMPPQLTPLDLQAGGASDLQPVTAAVQHRQQSQRSSQQLIQQFVEGQLQLKQALMDTEGDDLHADLCAWASQIPPGIPDELRNIANAGVACDASATKFASQLLSPTHPGTRTDPLPRKRQRRLPPAWFKPKSAEDLLLPKGVEQLRTAMATALDRLTRIKAGEKFRTNKEEDTLVIGEDMMKPPARGVLWDLRTITDSDGNIHSEVRPLNFDEPIDSHLNVEMLKTELADFTDQEVLSMLIEGAQFKADVEYQIVILPHLSSLPNGVESVEKELRRLEKLGWYEFYNDLPFVPFRCLPQGSTSRKFEPDRWRRTTDGGAPRYLLFDSTGVEVTPLNVAAHGATGVKPIKAKNSSRWVKEIKPSIQELMLDLLVLLHAALQVFFQPIFDGTDDAKDYFNQLQVAPHDRWMTGVHWTDLSPDQSHPWGSCVEEKVLGFGISTNSNIAQRCSHGLVHMFTKRFDLIEEQHFNQETDPQRVDWIAKRKALGPGQCRLYLVKIFTDDVKLCVVGVQRAVRLLRCWSQFCAELNLIMAIPVKRVLGCSSPWLGFLTCGIFGVVAVPQAKIVQAVDGLSALVEGKPQRFDVYRSLCGFLEHLVPFDGSGRSSMYGMYDVMRCADVYGPAAMIFPSPLVQRQAAHRIRVLTRTPYVTATMMEELPATQLIKAPLQALAYIYTDAAKGGGPCYLAGYCHGLRWRIPIRAKLQQLPIVALEFLAWLVSFIVFYRHIRHHIGIALCSDSHTSLQVVSKNAAHSPLMQTLHSMLLDTSEFQQLKHKLLVGHVYSEGNTLSDHDSRGKYAECRLIAAQLGIRLRTLPIPARAWAMCNTDFAHLLTERDMTMNAVGLMSVDRDGVPLLCCGAILIDHHFAAELQWPSGYIRQMWDLILLSDKAADPGEDLNLWLQVAAYAISRPRLHFIPPLATLIEAAVEQTTNAVAATGIDFDALPAPQQLQLCSMYAQLVPLSPALYVTLAHTALWHWGVCSWLQIPATGITVADGAGDRSGRMVGNPAGRASELKDGHWDENTIDLNYPTYNSNQLRHCDHMYQGTLLGFAGALHLPKVNLLAPTQRPPAVTSPLVGRLHLPPPATAPCLSAARPPRTMLCGPLHLPRTPGGGSLASAKSPLLLPPPEPPPTSVSARAPPLVKFGSSLARAKPPLRLPPPEPPPGQLRFTRPARRPPSPTPWVVPCPNHQPPAPHRAAAQPPQHHRQLLTAGKYGISNSAAAAAMQQQVSACLKEAFAPNTLKSEGTHWSYWLRYTAYLGTATLRDNVAANLGIDVNGHYTEQQILRFAPLWIGQNCMKGRRVVDGATVPDPLPDSAMQVVHTISRIHHRHGLQLAKVNFKHLLDGMCRGYKRTYGLLALQQQSHEPFTREEVTALVTPPSGMFVDARTRVGNNVRWLSFNAAQCVSAETGDRRADLAIDTDIAAADDPFDTASKMSRSNLTWIISGRHVADPTAEELRTLNAGDMAVLVSATQKNDQFGFRYSNRPRYLPYALHPHSAARALAALELASPVHGALRGKVPLLPADNSHRPWALTELSSTLTALQSKLKLSTKKGWHGWRVYLACALLSTNHSAAAIQALCHWKTLDAEAVYARFEPQSYAACLLAASTATVSSVLAPHLPQLDLSTQLCELATAAAPPAPAPPAPPHAIETSSVPPRKRGRPRKHPLPVTKATPRKRGRPRKHPLPAAPASPPRKRGRPRKHPL